MKALLLLALVGAVGCTPAASAPVAAPPSPERGLRVQLEVDDVGDREVVVRLAVQDDDGGGPGYRVQYGDGRYDEVVLASAACTLLPDTSPVPPQPLDEVVVLRHRYAGPGERAVQVRVVSQRPCSGVPDEEAYAQEQVTVG